MATICLNDENATKLVFGYLRQHFGSSMRLDDIGNIIKNYYLFKYQLCQFSDKFVHVTFRGDNEYEVNKLSNDRYLMEKQSIRIFKFALA